MIMDGTLIFSDQQAVTASAVSTNVLYTGKRELSFGNDLDLSIRVGADFATCTSLQVIIQTSVDEAFTSPVAIATSQAVPVATLKKGFTFPDLRVVPKGNLGYLRLSYVIAGSAATTGKINAAIVNGLSESYDDM